MKWSYQVDFINLHTGSRRHRQKPQISWEPVKTGAGVMKVLYGIRWESFSLFDGKVKGSDGGLQCTEANS